MEQRTELAKLISTSVPRPVMKRHHPIIAAWIVQHAKDREVFFRGGGGSYLGWFSNVDHRRHRILDQIFYQVEAHGLVPRSDGRPNFHFEFQGEKVHCMLEPTHERVPGTEKQRIALHFIIADPMLDEAAVRRKWSDGPTQLERQIPEIASALAAIATAMVGARHTAERRTQGALIARQAQPLEQVDNDSLLTLLKMAEQHRSALLLRRFLASLARNNSDLSVVVAGRALHQWLSWANAQVDKFDPLGRGMEQVFGEVARTLQQASKRGRKQ